MRSDSIEEATGRLSMAQGFGAQSFAVTMFFSLPSEHAGASLSHSVQIHSPPSTALVVLPVPVSWIQAE